MIEKARRTAAKFIQEGEWEKITEQSVVAIYVSSEGFSKYSL